MKILSIETSCDETGIAVLSASAEAMAHRGNNPITLLGNALASQIALHAQYGGVFPAMAKRAHAEKMVPLLKAALEEAGMLKELPSGGTDGAAARDAILAICTREDEMVTDFVELFNTYQKPAIDYIAVTVGPGLEPALWVGINAAKVLSTVWDIPVIPVNHMEGHVVTAAVTEIAANPPEHLDDSDGRPVVTSSEVMARKKKQDVLAGSLPRYYEFKNLEFPLLALLVSGGHTELVLTNSYGDYEKIGQTRDDAVGEAFDKVARMLGLPYPGGPAVSKLAREFRSSGKDQPFVLPRPMLHSGDYDFSFSGIKTATLYAIRDLTNQNKRDLIDDEKMALAAAFEDAVVEVLIKKTARAVEEFHTQTVVVGGGVAGNNFLREKLTGYLETGSLSTRVLFPEQWLATDNAVMIGLAALARAQSGSITTQDAMTLKANGNLSIAE